MGGPCTCYCPVLQHSVVDSFVELDLRMFEVALCGHGSWHMAHLYVAGSVLGGASNLLLTSLLFAVLGEEDLCWGFEF